MAQAPSTRPDRPTHPSTAEFHCLGRQHLSRFLERRRADPSFPAEMSLAENLVEVLRKANEFVPSSAGSILLDDPVEKNEDRRDNHLTFVAVFGERSAALLGRTISSDQGIAGRVYLTGKAHVSDDASDDEDFCSLFDEAIEHETRSLIAIPIRIGQEVCGVLELINRQETPSFSEADRNLLEIFADYIAISIQNILDGRRAQEIAKRDNLTGLYNDRFLHIALEAAIRDCQQEGRDLALLFLDLDFFKRINDSHGHLAGSQVLREVGHLLQKAVKPVAGMAARYGGDEFVIAVPGFGLDQGVDLAERVRSEILDTVFSSTPAEIQQEPLHLKGLTASVGVATLRRHLADDLSIARAKGTLLRLADSAMYVAKETGRNRTAVAGEPVRRR